MFRGLAPAPDVLQKEAETSQGAAMAFAQASRRPIDGAVATMGVSDRVTFLRKTYAHLGVAVIAWAVLTAALMHTTASLEFSRWALVGRWNWLLVIALFMAAGYIAERLAMSQSSRGMQYVGLGVGLLAYSVIFQPLLWIVFTVFKADAVAMITEAAVITGVIFVGLTLTVFLTKKDFSFMRGALMIGAFASLGIIIASAIFGFHLGAIFAGFMIVLMAGYILYQTSLVMSYFPPQGYVAASLMLFSTIATLFWYVLRLMMEMNRR
jgi:FtsH-binding integral membrane protein